MGAVIPFLVPTAAAQRTYSEDVRPIVSAKCASCHNADRSRGGVNVASYDALMEGGAGGDIVAPGDVAASVLYGVVAHTREPKMPRNQPRLPDEELTIIREWIEQGCVEKQGGAPVKAEAPLVGMAMGGKPIAKPEGPPIMPRGVPLSPVNTTPRAGAITALAAHPWSPLVAVRGHRQVLLYGTRSLDLLGVLPFDEGQPETLRFSRSGELLIVGGGRGGQSGTVAVWSVRSGERVATLGEQFDAVLAADIDPSQRFVALGGPSRIVAVHDVSSGRLIRKVENHTDWITAVGYSPDGILLATADRAGGLHVWEAESGAPFYALNGHQGAVTSLDWRADANVLASAGEDGQIRLWEMHGGGAIKAWSAHAGGTLCVRFARDGRLVTAGRDRLVKVWDTSGKQLRALDGFSDITLAAETTADDAAIVVGDLAGEVRIYDAADGALVGHLRANPEPFSTQLAAALEALAEARSKRDVHRGVRDQARARIEALRAQFKSAEQELAQIEAAGTPFEEAVAGAVRMASRWQAEECRVQLVAAKSELDGSSQRLEEVRQQAIQVDQAAANANEALRKAQERANSLPGLIEARKANVQQAREEVEAAGRTVVLSEQAAAQQSTMIDTLAPAVAAILSHAETAPANEHLKTAADRANESLAALRAELAERQASVDYARTQLGEAEARSTASATALADAESESQSAPGRLATLGDEVAKFSVSLAEAKASVAEAEAAQLVAAAPVADLEQRLEALLNAADVVDTSKH